jgi:hypothetical protein
MWMNKKILNSDEEQQIEKLEEERKELEREMMKAYGKERIEIYKRIIVIGEQIREIKYTNYTRK